MAHRPCVSCCHSALEAIVLRRERWCRVSGCRRGFQGYTPPCRSSLIVGCESQLLVPADRRSNETLRGGPPSTQRSVTVTTAEGCRNGALLQRALADGGNAVKQFRDVAEGLV